MYDHNAVNLVLSMNRLHNCQRSKLKPKRMASSYHSDIHPFKKKEYKKYRYINVK